MSARTIAAWILVVGIALIGFYWYPTSWSASAFIVVFYPALSASLLAISLTVLLIDRANEQRDQRQLKKRLIWEMGSSDQGFANRAAKELRDAGWLFDGSLKGVDFTLANLERAQLDNACLEGAVLAGANLQLASLDAADLRHANLEGAIAEKLKARKAKLTGAKLHKAILSHANLEEIEADNGTDLMGSSLMRASLRGANLKGAQLEECDLLEADLTGSDLAGANLLRANIAGALLDDVNLERADLSELQGWEDVKSFQRAKISGVRNAPAGFREWAVEKGAMEIAAQPGAHQ